MNGKDTKRADCRSRKSLKRRRRQRAQKQKEREAQGRSQEGGNQQAINADLVIAKNECAELSKQLDNEVKRRKTLEGENLELCKKLEKIQKTNSKMRNEAGGTYAGQVYHVIESSKKKSTCSMINSIRLIDPSNLTTTEDENPSFLGEGSFGSVKKMLFCDRIEVAVKFLKGDATEKHLMHEAKAMYEIGNHPGIPYFYGVCMRDKSFMLIMECCVQDGRVITLTDAVNSLELSHFSWSQILYKLTEALNFIHSKGFVHNDLKGNNVLLIKKQEIWQPVIIDYGKCVKVAEAKAQRSTSLPREKLCYTAPEVLSGRHPPSKASDIYSLGIMFQKLNAKLPFIVISQDIIMACCHENHFTRIKDTVLLNKLKQ